MTLRESDSVTQTASKPLSPQSGCTDPRPHLQGVETDFLKIIHKRYTSKNWPQRRMVVGSRAAIMHYQKGLGFNRKMTRNTKKQDRGSTHKKKAGEAASERPRQCNEQAKSPV